MRDFGDDANVAFQSRNDADGDNLLLPLREKEGARVSIDAWEG